MVDSGDSPDTNDQHQRTGTDRAEGTPSSVALADLDARRHAVVRAHPDQSADLAFWSAALALDRWHFVANLEDATRAMDEGSLSSGLRTQDAQGRGMTHVFSSPERASRGFDTAYAANQKGETPHQVLSLSVADALLHACRIAHASGEPALMMDQYIDDVGGYGTHAMDLLGYYDFFVGPLPAQAIPYAGAVANERGDGNMLRAVYRAAIRHGTLLVATLGESVHVIRNERGLFGMCYSSEHGAQRHLDRDKSDGFLPMSFAQLVEMDAALREHHGDLWQSFVLDDVVAVLPEFAAGALACPEGPSKNAQTGSWGSHA